VKKVLAVFAYDIEEHLRSMDIPEDRIKRIDEQQRKHVDTKLPVLFKEVK